MAALRDLTPSGLRRLSMDERKRLLEAKTLRIETITIYRSASLLGQPT